MAAWRSYRGDKNIDTYWQYVYAIADKVEDTWRRLFGTYKRTLQQTSVAAVEEAVRSGGVGFLNAKIPYEEAVTTLQDGAKDAYGKVVVHAATASAKRLIKKDAVGFETSFTLDNPFVAGVIATAVGGMVRQVDNETRLGIQQVILQAFQNGDPPSVVARKIRDMIGLTGRDAQAVYNYYRELVKAGLPETKIDALVDKYTDKKLRERAERIARTEMNSAANAGTQAAWREADRQGLLSPWTKREWIAAVEDPRTCPVCRLLDGQRVGLNEPFYAGGRAVMMPPAHVNCLLPGTKVLASNLVATYKRWFEGVVVTLCTAGGKKLAVTFNHPILTPRGWVPAGLLAEGDYVISASSDNTLTRLLEPDNQHMPTAIEQVADAFKMACSVVSGTMPISAKDFHGDGINGEVEIVYSNLFLLDEFNSSLQQAISKHPFTGRNIAPTTNLTGTRLHQFSGFRNNSTADSIMGSGSQFQSLCGRHSLHSDYTSLRTATGRYPSISENQTDRRTQDSVSFSECQYRIARAIALAEFATNIGIFDRPLLSSGFLEDPAPILASIRAMGNAPLRGYPIDSGHANTKLLANIQDVAPGGISVTQLISIEKRWLGTHVYNLQTTQGWYIADGIITHNCRCTLGLWTEIPR